MMLPLLIAAVLPGTLISAVTAGYPPGSLSPEDPVADSGRPVVLVLHGRGLRGSDTTRLRIDWTRDLQEGLEVISDAPRLREDDVRLVWYADDLDSPAGPGCPARVGPEQSNGWARDVGAALESIGTLLGLVAPLLGPGERMALEAIAGDLAFLGNDRRRCGAEARLMEALARADREGRPVLLVAHSFGALVAYDHFRSRDPADAPAVERWITVGSLLGYPELRDLLMPGEGGTGLPPGVGSWINVHDPRDLLSAPLEGLQEPGKIQDRRTENIARGDPHDPGRYLSDPATAGALAEAWGASSARSGEPQDSSTQSAISPTTRL